MTHEDIKNMIKKQKTAKNKKENQSNEYMLIKNGEDEFDVLNKGSINDDKSEYTSKEIEDLNKEINELGLEHNDHDDINENNENIESLKQQILDN